MATWRLGWRHLGPVLVGMAVGAICLVMWSSSASALDAPTPPPPSLSAGLDQALGQVTAPLDQLLDPLGVEVAPVVDPITDQVVVPTVDAVETTVGELTQVLPVPPAPSVPGLPVLPEAQGLPGADAATDALVTPPGTGTSAVAGASDLSAGGTSSHDRSSPRPADELGVVGDRTEPASSEGGSSSGPTLPTPAPLVEAAVGSLATTAGQGSGLVLLAVLAGLAAVAANPRSRRLTLVGPRSPSALAYAVASPPD